MFSRFAAVAVAALVVHPGFSTARAQSAEDLEVVASVTPAPGNITVTSDNRIFVSLHQLYQPPMAVAELVDGELVPFPDAAWNNPETAGPNRFFAVLGLQVDAAQRLWLLDNAVGFEGQGPRLVAWDLTTNTLDRIIEMPEGTFAPNSFFNDLAVDVESETVYIADTAFGPNAALVVVDLSSGSVRRILDSAPSTAPEPIDLAVNGKTLAFMQPDGTTTSLQLGADSIALDADNEWLYFGPMSGRTLYRAKAADLRDPSLDDAALSARVEAFAEKPVSDGISVDTAGNIYITDFTNSAIGVIDHTNREYRQLYQDSKLLSWPDAFSFGPDGQVYATATQLHLSPVLNGGANEVEPPFHILAFPGLAPGVTGR